MPKSRLFWNEEKKQFEVEITSRKGNQVKMSVAAAHLSADLPKTLTDEIVEVEFERDAHGNPIKARLAGKDWIEPTAKPQKTDYTKKDTASHRDRPEFSSRQKDFSKSTEEEIETMNPEFHNPYNFVPAPPRSEITGELGDRAPIGHDRFYPDYYTGKLTVKMTVETPLLVLDTARINVSGEHKSFPIKLDANDKPYIEPTAVKGMLRSAYEAITNSRMSVFNKHDERLGFRMESTEGAMMVPVRMEGKEGEEKIVFYTGTSNLVSDGKKDGSPQSGNPLCAAWIPTYDSRNTCRISPNSDITLRLIDENRVPNHKEEVWAWLEEFEKFTRKDRDKRAGTTKERWRYQSTFKYWRVRAIAKTEAVIDSKKPPKSTRKPPQQILDETPNDKRPWDKVHVQTNRPLVKVKGFICITGKNTIENDKANDYTSPNIENKHDERLFFNFYNNAYQTQYKKIDLTPILRKQWNDLIKNYRETHIKDISTPPKARKNNRDVPLQWSRQIRKTKESEIPPNAKLLYEKLENETLCYARVKHKTGNEFEVLEIYPVIISRRLHKYSPSELLAKGLKPANGNKDFLLVDNGLHPTKFIFQLSPADRVFGWVRQDKPRDADLIGEEKGSLKKIREIGAYRGQTRIGTVHLTNEFAEKPFDESIQIFGKDDELKKWLPLNILGQPKPQQGRFYVAEDKNGKSQNRYDEIKNEGEQQKIFRNNEKAGYNQVEKGLRGRKVYPHHAHTERDEFWFEGIKPLFEDDLDTSKDYWRVPFGSKAKYFREYLRPRKEKKNKETNEIEKYEQQRDSQNRSIQGWVKKGTEFQFDIHFTNLSDVELGALIWLLQLPANHFHRFGGGKPFGFGSVRLEVENSEIYEGDELKKRYFSLDPKNQENTPREAFIGKFQKAVLNAYNLEAKISDEQVEAEFEKISFIAAFKCACEGFATGLPIHYPRARHINKDDPNKPLPPHRDGLSYEWFVENNKKPNQDNSETRLALPDIDKDEGLPIFRHKGKS
ncbi:MAG TPA: TIGR03986 family CRISPR-associated RAMP protein [Pyrinomonadaceae bacterium]|nr:TIGR03986 family CRISPR-associated RAMP protein [Pyrinomonadaceae bacterium]